MFSLEVSVRHPRRFSPAFDSLQDRIVPSSVVVAPTTTATPVAIVADETGSPSDAPSGDDSYPLILSPPPSAPNPIPTLC